MTQAEESEFERKLAAWHSLTGVDNADDATAEVALFMWQAGRDAVLKELSEQEPVAWKFEEAVPAYSNEKGRCTTAGNKRLVSFAAPDFTDPHIHHVVPLLPRPTHKKVG
jgi:hypothetical protein